MKKLVLIFAVVLVNCSVFAQQSVKLGVGEYFLGLSSGYGGFMPIGDKSFSLGHNDNVNGNLFSPLMVSTVGRYAFGNKSVMVNSAKNEMVIPSGCEIFSSGTSLRHAFLTAVSKNMKPDGKVPPEEFFSAPIYNTWSALGSALCSESVKEYVDQLLSIGFKPGIIIIDNGWQSHNGAFNFDPVRFPNPVDFVSYLHLKGFKVILQVTPMVSPDCLDFKKLKNEDRLEVDVNTSLPRIEDWYGGYSAVLDMSKPENVSYVRSSLHMLTERFGVDGFKFDYVVYNGYVSSDEYIKRISQWTKLASEYEYHLILGSYKDDGKTIVGQLNYNKPVWSSLPIVLAEAINAGIAGYPFIVPEPIGGGFVLSDTTEAIDPDFIVRLAQLQAFFPSMQFSVPVGQLLSAEQKKLVNNAVQMHESLLPYISQLAKDAAMTGEPIIHSMEYNFPGKGFYDCNDQFMLGARYLVAPVMRADGIRIVRLPVGVWIDDRGKRHKGPAIIKLKVPIDRILYFRAAKDVKIN